MVGRVNDGWAESLVGSVTGSKRAQAADSDYATDTTKIRKEASIHRKPSQCAFETGGAVWCHLVMVKIGMH